MNQPKDSGRRTALALAAAAGLGLLIFAFYVPVYRTRHYSLPLGFDASWYIWRAQVAAAQGIGALDTAVRPGHAILAATLGAVTGRSQLELGVVLPLALVSVFALTVGALVRVALWRDRWSWAVAVAVSGTLLGTTRLVSENVANLLNLTMVAAAVAALARRREGGRGFAAAVALLVAAGLAHWVFLAVFGGVFAVAFALALPSSLRARRAGLGMVDTESGLLAAAGLSAAAVLGVTIAGVLRAPFQTFEIKEDPARYRPKLANDLRALFLPALGPVAAGGAVALARESPAQPAGRAAVAHSPAPGRTLVLRLLAAWTVVSVAGVVFGGVTLNLPPHRFLALVVAVPVAVAVAAAIRWIATWVGRDSRRTSGAVAAVVTVLAVAAVSVPGALRWYRRGPGEWISPTGLQEALTAARYVSAVPQGRPVVFLVDTKGEAGVLSGALKERIIRMGMPAGREEDVHVYVGDAPDLLAGRPTAFRSALVREAAQPFWEDVRAVLPEHPPILVLRAFAGPAFAAAVGTRPGAEIGPGVALLRGKAPTRSLPPAPAPRAVPRTRAALPLGLAILVLLGVAGAGWTRVLFGPDLSPEAFAAMVPTVGAAALMIGGLIPARLGMGLGSAGGIALYAVVTVAGGMVAWGPALRGGRPTRAKSEAGV